MRRERRERGGERGGERIEREERELRRKWRERGGEKVKEREERERRRVRWSWRSLFPRDQSNIPSHSHSLASHPTFPPS